MNRKRIAAILLVSLIVAVSCTNRGRSAIDQRSDTALAQRLNGFSRPLVAGEEGLAAALPVVSNSTRILLLTADGAAPLTRPLRADDLCDERFLVLYQGVGDAAWLLDPRTSTVEVAVDGMVFCRALPVDGDARLGAFQCTLRLDGGDLRVDAIQRVSSAGQDCRMPVWVPSRGTVYEVIEADGGRHLWLAEERLAEERGPVPLLTPPRQARQPQALPDGRVAYFAEDTSGWSRYAYDFTGEPARLPLAQPVTQPHLRPAIRKHGDGIEAVLLRIPERIDLATILALVEAQHPAVNRARALLAVSLVEAGQSGLARWPTLAVGLFTTPVTGLLVEGGAVYSGDYLAEGLSRGVIGLVQPLLDFGRNAHLEAAALERVAVATDALAEEVQRRSAEAASHAVAAERYRELAAHFTIVERCWRDRTEAAARRSAAGYGSAAAEAETARGLALGSAAVTTNRHLAAYHRARLLRCCGIDERMEVDVASGAQAWDEASLPDLQTLVAGALIDQPRLRAARRELVVAFHVAEAGADLRPSLSAQASYGQTRDDSFTATDDYMTLGLAGELPLAAPKAAGLHRQRSLELAVALRAAEEAEAEAVAAEVEMAWLEFQRARGEYTGARGQAANADDRLRILRLRAQGSTVDGATGATTSDAVAAARCIQAEARAAACAAGWEVGARLIKALGSAGRARDIAARMAELTPAHASAARTATWLWRTADIQPGGPALAAMEDAVTRWRLGRIALFVGGSTDPFASAAARAGLDRFAGRCRQRGVVLWALLGDPAWFGAADDDIRAEVAHASALAVQANQAAQVTGAEPVFHGLELDLEPQALPGWSDPAQRPLLAARCVALVALVRKALPPQIPLWLDAPPQLLVEIGHDLEPHLDGVVVMCYAHDANAVTAAARTAAAAWPKPYALAVELTPTAEGANLSAASDEEVRALLQKLVADHAGERFAGIALHDLSSLAARPASAPPEIR